MSDLGQRAIACKRWRWLPGMRTLAPLDEFGEPLDRPHRVPDGDKHKRWPRGLDECDFVPDLHDAATVGCLRALVREAWSDYAWDIGEDYTGASFDVVDGPSIIEVGPRALVRVLVAALEAAPASEENT